MELLQALAETPVAVWLRRPGPAYPLVSAGHIMALGLLVGAIFTLDLRLLGLFRRQPLGVLGPVLSRMAAAGLVLAICTGVLLLSVRAVDYAANTALQVKLGLVALGAANALLLRALPFWSRALDGGRVHPVLKVQALLSLLIWAGAVMAGRWIGFLM